MLLLAEEEIELDSFQLFTLPGLPKEFMSIQGEREITVTLAFDPPTRQTRGDSYLGVRMYAHLFRNVSPDALMKRLKAMTAEEREMLGKDSVSLSKMPRCQRVQLEPGVTFYEVAHSSGVAHVFVDLTGDTMGMTWYLPSCARACGRLWRLTDSASQLWCQSHTAIRPFNSTRISDSGLRCGSKCACAYNRSTMTVT